MRNNGRNLLVFDSAYTYEMLIERNLESFVTCRDLDGLIGHVWSINPLADAERPSGDPDRYGPPRIERLAHRHTVIEGRMGRTRYGRWLMPLNFIFAQVSLLFTVLRLCRAHEIAIVRAEDPFVNGAYAWLISRIFKKPLMVGVWGNPGAIRRDTGRPLMAKAFRTVRVEEAWEGKVLRAAATVMVQNDDNASYVASRGVSPARIARFSVGNALHGAHWVDPLCRVTGLPDLVALGASGIGTVLCITRLIEEKLPEHAVQAVAELRNVGVECELVFVGDGGMRESLEVLATAAGIGDVVFFAGGRDQEWLARVIPEASAVVVPLAGRALAEVALGAAPVVAYDIDWHSDLVETGSTGELVPFADATAMAGALGRLIEEPARARRLGAGLRDRAMGVMSPGKINREQAAAYERLSAGGW